MEELQRQIDELKSELETLKNAKDLDHNKLMYDSFFQGKDITIVGDLGSYDSTLERTVSISTTPTSFIVPEDPIGTAKIKIGSTYYRILLYSLT